MAIKVGPNSAVSASGSGAEVQIVDAVVDSGDLAGAIDTAGSGEFLLRPADQQVAFTGDAAIQRGDIEPFATSLPATQVTGKAK